MFVHVALNQNNAIYESLFYHGNKSQSFHGSLQYSALSCFSGFEMVKLMGGGGGQGGIILSECTLPTVQCSALHSY